MPESLVWRLDEVGRDRVQSASPCLRTESPDLALRVRGPKAHPAVPNRQRGCRVAPSNWFVGLGRTATHSRRAWPFVATTPHFFVLLKPPESSSQVCPIWSPEGRFWFGTGTSTTSDPERASLWSRQVLLGLRGGPHSLELTVNLRRVRLARSPPKDRTVLGGPSQVVAPTTAGKEERVRGLLRKSDGRRRCGPLRCPCRDGLLPRTPTVPRSTLRDC